VSISQCGLLIFELGNSYLLPFRHESQPQNVKKNFSGSSDGIKEWVSTGFEFFAEWSKMEFCMYTLQHICQMLI
jgi:hypothetical protein